jgi:hypothetical protein
MVGHKALGVRQVRHAEQVDLVHHDQADPASERPHMHDRMHGELVLQPVSALRLHAAATAPVHPARRGASLVVVDVDPDADPPKLLVIGPDGAGNLLEVVVLTLADDRVLVIHAMPPRAYYDLLPVGGDADA